MTNDPLMVAVANLIKVKGRHHTEQAYKQLVEAYDAALTAHQELPKGESDADKVDAIRAVIAERERQKSIEGWTEAHDDEHDDRSLAQAAASYLNHYIGRQWVYADGDIDKYQRENAPDTWPDSWHVTGWKPKNPRRDLVRSAALIIAEIERIDRATADKENKND